jgi:hypothetical protein
MKAIHANDSEFKEPVKVLASTVQKLLAAFERAGFKFATHRDAQAAC